MSVEPAVAHKKVKAGSSRAFGLAFAGFFLLMAIYPLVFRHGPPRLWAAGISAAFLLVTLLAPGLLAPLNMLWFRLGLVLHAIVNPIVMGLVFVFSVIPVGLLLRLSGKSLLGNCVTEEPHRWGRWGRRQGLRRPARRECTFAG